QPEQLAAYARLASVLYGTMKSPEQAMRVLDRMIEANPPSARALLIRCRLALQAGDGNRAVSDLLEARKLGRRDPDVLLTAADVAAANPNAAQLDANEIYDDLTALLEKPSPDARVYAALAVMDMVFGRISDAERLLTTGLEVYPDRFDLRVRLVALLIDAGRFDEAESHLQKLRKTDASAPVIRAASQLLSGYIRLRRGNWLETVDLLEGVRPELDDLKLLRTWANLWLAETYRGLKDQEAEVAVYRRIVDFDPGSVEARMGLVAALATKGEFEGAIAHTRVQDDDERVPLLVIRLLIERNLARPKEQQNWGEVESLLISAERKMFGSPRIPILRSRILELKGQFEQARRVLQEAATRDERQILYQTALARLLLRTGQQSAVPSLLQQAEQVQPDHIDLLITRIMYWNSLPSATEITDRLTEAEQHLAGYSSGEQLRVLQLLAEAWALRGNREAVLRIRQRSVDLIPRDPETRLLAFEAALDAGDQAAADNILEGLRRIEGESGPYYSACQALERIRLAERDGDRSHLIGAERWLSQAQDRKANWSLVSALRGVLCELNGDGDDAALRHYRNALEQGSNNPDLLIRVVRILYLRGDINAAHAEIRRMQSHFALSGLPQSILPPAAAVALAARDFSATAEYCREWLSFAPDNWRAYLILGMAQDALMLTEDAEVSLGQAVQVGADKSEPWTALLEFAIRHDDSRLAASTVEQMKTHLGEAESPAILARYYDLIGDSESAGRFHELAVRRIADPPACFTAADHFAAIGNRPRAVELYRQALETEEGIRRELSVQMSQRDYLVAVLERTVNPREVRLRLAAVLADGPYSDFQEAVRLIRHGVTGNGDREFNIALAQLLASRSEIADHRREALSILSGLSRSAPELPQRIQLTMARLLERDGRLSEAGDLFDRLAANSEDDAVVALAVIDRYVRTRNSDKAIRMFSRLEKQNLPPEVMVPLAVQVFAVSDAPATGLKRLDDWIASSPDPQEKQTRRQNAAELLSRVLARRPSGKPGTIAVLGEAAERLFSAIDRTQADAASKYAEFLLRRKRFDEAFRQADECAKTEGLLSVAAADVFVSLSASEQLTSEQCTRIDGLFSAALQVTRSPELLKRYAAFLHFRQRYTEEESLYREIMTAAPEDATVMNNLAWLLVCRDKEAEPAQKLIHSAILVAGPVPQLMDTQAVLFVVSGETDKAIEILEQRARDDSGDPAAQFRLAWAYWKAGDHAAAIATFRTAVDLGLNEESMDPLIRDQFAPLAAEAS
ncbi:MAG: tetratricopeptide repeat protein, partial [Planctomycetaceae bacterium]|nr:tetratricopeptide repeat protein [Planctomycetaceae bacterium]